MSDVFRSKDAQNNNTAQEKTERNNAGGKISFSIGDDVGIDSPKAEESQVRFSVVEDPFEVARLEAGKKEKGYRNVVLNDDGTMGSPMASKLGNTGKGRKATTPFMMNTWEKSDENPDLADENGKVDLIKPGGKTVGKVDYNPYIHIRPDKVNKQFKQAWERPNLVYVEVEYPASELTSGYKADKAKKTVGKHPWNGEELILSRWDKVVRVVPWEEVADDWVERFKDRGAEFDIIPPKLLPILAERGVKILPPHKGMGKACNDAYKEWKKENDSAEEGRVRFSVGKGMSKEEAKSFIQRMQESAETADEIELTPDNWIELFGEDGIVSTPIGEVKMGENQYFKLAQQGREGKLGMVKPTLENPDIIVEDYRPAKDGNQERDYSYVFIKTFVNNNGERYYHFTSVTVQKDGKEVVISNQERRPNRISKILQQGKISWINEMFSSHPKTRIEKSVPLSDSNKPTSTDNQPALLGINSPELSDSKDNVNSSTPQGKNEEISKNNENSSGILLKVDEDYMSAVESGDMETAGRMVRDAARRAMPDTKVVDENGEPLVVYHGTDEEFNVFKTYDDTGVRNRYDENPSDHFLFTPDDSAASDYGEEKAVYLNAENVLRADSKEAVSEIIRDQMHFLDELAPADWSIDSETVEEFIDTFVDEDGRLFYYSDADERESLECWQAIQNAIANYARENGYDGFMFNDSTRGEQHETYAVFDPNQIKSADPITRDDAGNVIPLSERFNPEKDDIRFSVSDKEVFDRAKERFGVTDDLSEAGYILPDGGLLDFSGRHQADEGQDVSNLRGNRTVDHRDIKQLNYEADGNTPSGMETSMQDFIERGAIRIDDNAGSINLSQKPTPKQAQMLRRFIQRNNGYVIVEIGNGWDTQHYGEYDDGTKASKVLGDIDRYFDEGIRFSITPEEGEIERRAKENGTWLKAPNGKPTRLTSRQWVMVRTKAFKKWFGNWEVAAYLEEAKRLSPIDPKKYPTKDTPEKTYLSLGDATNKRDKTTVKFDHEAFKKNYKVGLKFEKVIPALKDIFEESILVLSETDTKAGTARLDGTVHKYHRNFKEYRQYIGKAIIDGQEEFVRFTVRMQKNQNGVHNVFVTDVDIYENLPRNASLPTSNVGARLVNGRVVDTKVENIFYIAKNSSKNVDENGEPLVVYHGSGEYEFNTFDNRSDIGYHFGNRDQAMMRNYMTVDYEGVIRPFFLNIKNPLFLNGDAGSWVGNELANYLLREESEREGGSRLSDIPRGGAHINPFKDAEDIAQLREISEMGNEESNEAMRNFLIGKGYDGIVYENDVEVSPDGEDNRSYIAFYPNQIKSAAPETYDDAGNVIPLSERFNPAKEDVRFSIGDAVDIDSPATVKEGFAPEDLDDGHMTLPQVKEYVQSVKVPERITSMSQAVTWTYKTLGRIRGTFNRLYGEKGKKRRIVRVF